MDVVAEVIDGALALLHLAEQSGVSDQGHGHLQREDDFGVDLEVLMGLRGRIGQVEEGVGVDGRRIIDPSVVLELLQEAPDDGDDEHEELACLLPVVVTIVRQRQRESLLGERFNLPLQVDEVLAGIDELIALLEEQVRGHREVRELHVGDVGKGELGPGVARRILQCKRIGGDEGGHDLLSIRGIKV